MGRNNQKRRAEKKRREQRSSTGARSAWRQGVGDADARRAAELVRGGGVAAASGRASALASAAEALVSLARGARPGAVTLAVGSGVTTALAGTWEDGWQPVEVARQVRRRCGALHADLVVAGLSDAGCWEEACGTAMPEAWAAQLQALGAPQVRGPGHDWLAAWLAGRPSDQVLADAITAALEAVGALLCLPPIEPLLVPPRRWRESAGAGPVGKADDPVLAKVRGLLAKAESTTFDAEAEALSAKAQELMARHAIDDAVARSGGAVRESPTTRRIAVDDPYASAKSQLLVVVCEANDVRSVWYQPFGMMAVIGFAADLDAVDALFTSLLVQATRAMVAKGRVADGRGRSRTRSFRQSFLVAFAHRIGERLAAAAAAARAQAEHELPTPLAPILASRAQEIDDEVARVFPHTRITRGPRVTNEAGWRAGRTAAELASLGPRQGMLAG